MKKKGFGGVKYEFPQNMKKERKGREEKRH